MCSLYSAAVAYCTDSGSSCHTSLFFFRVVVCHGVTTPKLLMRALLIRQLAQPCLSVHPSDQLDSRWTDFCEI